MKEYINLSVFFMSFIQHFSLHLFARQDGTATSAIKKIFLEYATLQDAVKAERELNGRQFGSSVVEVTHCSETDYSSGNLR